MDNKEFIDLEIISKYKYLDIFLNMKNVQIKIAETLILN
jgi:hypothetical protein